METVAKVGDAQDDILDQSIRDSYDDLKKQFVNKTLSE